MITKPTKKLTLVATTSQLKPTIPTTLNQAMRDENWKRSMSAEYDAQIANKTFELVPCERDQHVIDTRWVHTIKFFPSGDVDRYKSRWVA